MRISGRSMQCFIALIKEHGECRVERLAWKGSQATETTHITDHSLEDGKP
jgi:hypothetical protein